MCSGRITRKFIERAFARGAAAVLVSGCHIGDCHYIDANVQCKKRVERFWRTMEKKGIDKNRLHLGWFSAAEGEAFATKIKEMETVVAGTTPDEIEKSKEAYKKALEVGSS
jgi:heterodisulfide reductase subunit A